MSQPKHSEILEALNDRGEWERRLATWYQMRHDGLRRRNKPWPNASDMHFPLADDIIDKLKPTFISQVYATDTIATFVARKQQYAGYQGAASGWFDYQLKQESNFEEEIDITIDTMAQNGKCIVKVTWDSEEKRIAFESINPADLIVPAWTGPVRHADWIVHVQRYSREAYLALPAIFKKDEDTLARISGGDNSEQRGTLELARVSREGLTKGSKKGEIILWELYFRDEKRQWRVRTYSPSLESLDLRPEFGLPYNKGPFGAPKPPPPFGEFNFEVKERGYYSPRGVCERVKAEEVSLCKDWNTIKDYQTVTLQPTFYAKSGVPQNANLRQIPGQILPFEIAAVQYPQIPADLPMQMQGTQKLAMDRLAVPSVGAGRPLDPANKKTAAETNLIASIMNQGSDVRSRPFRRQLGFLLNLAWGIAIQYRIDELDYYFNEELMSAERAALEGDYRIEPSGSGDNNNRALVLQRAVARKQMFAGNPNINQLELDKSVLEADDPRLVKRLLINQGSQGAQQLEDQAQEISIMLLGFAAEVRPTDDDNAHITSLAQFVQKRAQSGEPMTPEFLRLVATHGQQHIEGLKKKAPQIYAQKGKALAAWVSEIQREAMAGQGNVIPMGGPAGAQPAAAAMAGGAQ